MYDLSRLFSPVTVSPVDRANYIEIPPTDILKPYVRCFWGYHTLENASYTHFIVIPDMCADVIFEFDHRTNKFSDVFCGVNDAPFFNSGFQAYRSVFAVRFYFWAANLFADQSLKYTLNAFTDPLVYFNDLKIAFEKIMLQRAAIRERIPLAENYLVSRLNKIKKMNNELMNAVYYILKLRGVTCVSDICNSAGVSERQLERIFTENTGVPPKKAVDLVRFQNVLRDMLHGEHDIMDIVYRYGFTDQPHLINNFKRYSGGPPGKALECFK